MASGDHRNTNPEPSDLSESQSSPSKKDQEKKVKVGSSKKMTQKEQSERFIETARELGVDEDNVSFHNAVIKILGKNSN